MTEEQLNKFFDGITAHNKEILDRESDANNRTKDFIELCEKSIFPHMKIQMYPEDSKFNDCGSKSDIDVFFKKINESGFEHELVEYLKQYLTNDELKDRLTEDNFMSNVKVPELIKIWQKNVKLKELKQEIAKKEQDLNQLKNKLNNSSTLDYSKGFVHEGY
jgi:hypothetical protein